MQSTLMVHHYTFLPSDIQILDLNIHLNFLDTTIIRGGTRLIKNLPLDASIHRITHPILIP